MIQILSEVLIDLCSELESFEFPLIVGGGLGIFFKVQEMQNKEKGTPTLLEAWPEPRSTNDIDLFLRPELLQNSNSELTPFAMALEKLGFTVVESAKYYQFFKPDPEISERGGVKIDLLTGPSDLFDEKKIKVDSRRVKPKKSSKIHAHHVNEAPTLLEGLREITLESNSQKGKTAKIFIPHPFTFLMMKLFAFKDRVEDENKDLGRYHALDLYSIVATMTEEEWETAKGFVQKLQENPSYVESTAIVKDFFSDEEKKGVIRLKESPYYSENFQIKEFLERVQELFSK